MENILNRLEDLTEYIVNDIQTEHIQNDLYVEYKELIDFIESYCFELMEYEEKVKYMQLYYVTIFTKDNFSIEDMNEFTQDCKDKGINPLHVIRLIN